MKNLLTETNVTEESVAVLDTLDSEFIKDVYEEIKSDKYNKRLLGQIVYSVYYKLKTKLDVQSDYSSYGSITFIIDIVTKLVTDKIEATV